ncbi:glycerate kinase [Amnibacterium flavum]|uniref:Glycerate kinase n=1 Tax=Amnibacterium flavum TaxID=2173173 RepID=A0A2V1HWJ0_9MICO|nr:glycerate kinase [Amnibacterium flavum]PVZ95569.1 glycerate kinase [Amnibacterium flavum]
MTQSALTVVIAPDSFKGTIDAADAARAIASGWTRTRPSDRVVIRPMADGGEGTLDAMAASADRSIRHALEVNGPDGRTVEASWLELDDRDIRTGLVEVASTSGITMLRELDGLDAQSTGFGQAIAAALDAGVDRLLLALGSSASSDGGAGMLRALGARLLDGDGDDIPSGNRGLADLARIDLSDLRAMPAGGATILSDVRSPLLGPRGAVNVFGPQKGITSNEIPAAEARMTRFADLLAATTGTDADTPGAGAAGGTGFALLAWGAEAVSGAETIADMAHLSDAIGSADIVITGEGRYDASSEHGKVVSVVRDRAQAAGRPALLIAGLVADEPRGFVDHESLTDTASSGAEARSDPARWLVECAARLAERTPEV